MQILLTFWNKIRIFIAAHMLMSAVAAVIVLCGIIYVYHAANTSAAATRYVLGAATRQTLISSVSGTGQISASNEVSIAPKASGNVTAVYVKVGQTVAAGAALAQIDPSDALKSVRDAQAGLETAQLSLQKLQEPADQSTQLSSSGAVTAAQSSVDQAYANATADISTSFVDFSTVIAGLKNILNNSSYMNDSQLLLKAGSGALEAKHQATLTLSVAQSAYDEATGEYQALSPSTASNEAIEEFLPTAERVATLVASAVKSTGSAVSLADSQITSGKPAQVATDLSSVAGFTSKANGDVATLQNDQTTIDSAKQSFSEKSASDTELQQGPDALDLRSAQLAVQQKENALADARETLADYTVRAPFAGVISTMDAQKGGTLSSDAITMITKQQVAEISLNELDIAKVKEGDKVTLTFDALPDLTLTGSVIEVNPVGAVSQGVVNYSVKIGFDTQDPRVLPGMSVSAAIITDTQQNALTVPNGAVHASSDGSTSYVLVLDAASDEASSTGVSSNAGVEGTPRQIEVTTGVSNDTDTQIVSGLTEGQEIVVRTVTTSAKSGAAATGAATTQRAGLFGVGGGGAGAAAGRATGARGGGFGG